MKDDPTSMRIAVGFVVYGYVSILLLTILPYIFSSYSTRT